MATTKKTMQVITTGIEREDPAEAVLEEVSAEDFVCETVGFFAELAADRFLTVVDGWNYENIGIILRMIDDFMNDHKGKEAVDLLKAVFITGGLAYAAEDLDVLDVCSEYVEEAHLCFICDFMYAEEMRWLADFCPDEGNQTRCVS